MSSAIAALVYWDGQPVEVAVLQAANRAVQARYPDGAWAWGEGAVGLAQADLATLPEDEPGLAHTCGPFRLVASCRLDNRAELWQQLPLDCRPAANTDSALLLAAYQAWGPACVSRLLGDFAFVIWDQRQQRLFAARDLSGTRALFYYQDAQRLFIATELAQILQDPTIPLVVDPPQVAEYFTPSFQWSSGWDQGMLQGIQPVPAGSTLVAEAGQVQVRPYWQWSQQEYAPCPVDDLLAEYRHLLDLALGARQRSRTPVGFELSGGLDSTALVGLGAARGEGQTLATFSLVFDETPAVNERDRIQRVLASLAAPAHAHFLAADFLFAPACLAPTWAPTSIGAPQTLTLTSAHAQLYALAVECGHRVLLSGEMGDALNDGYPWFYVDLLQRRKFAALGQQLQIHWRRSRRQTVRELAHHLWLWLMPLWAVRRGVQWSERRRLIETPMAELLTPAFQQAVVAHEQHYRQTQAQTLPARSPAMRELLTTFLPPMPYLGAPLGQPLERWHPYTDRRLFEFSLRLPPELKWEAAQSNYFLAARQHHRCALADLLPPAILVDNTGVDFGPVLAQSMTPARVHAWMQNDRVQVVEQGYVEASALAQLLQQKSPLPGDFRAILCFEAWLRAWLPGGGFAKLIPPRRL